MPKTIDIRSLKLFVGAKQIHPDVNLDAKKAELVAFIGQNGVGKSTLIRSISGLLAQKHGAIRIFEESVQHIKPALLAKQLSLVSPWREEVEYLSVFDFILMGRFPHKQGFRFSESDYEAVQNTLKQLNLEQFANRYIDKLSDGEYQRVSIARALVQDTPIILLDEPTAFLDVGNKYEIIELLRSLAHQANKTIVFSSHDLNIVLKLADKIWLMTPEKTCMGAPEDLIWQQKLDTLFHHNNYVFDAAQMDFIQKNQKQVKITKDQIIELTQKALFRKNIHNNVAYDVSIKNNTPVWEVSNQEYYSIYDFINNQ